MILPVVGYRLRGSPLIAFAVSGVPPGVGWTATRGTIVGTVVWHYSSALSNGCGCDGSNQTPLHALAINHHRRRIRLKWSALQIDGCRLQYR